MEIGRARAMGTGGIMSSPNPSNPASTFGAWDWHWRRSYSLKARDWGFYLPGAHFVPTLGESAGEL